MSAGGECAVVPENSYVRVTTERLPVGGSIPRHTHQQPYLTICLTSGRVQQLDGRNDVVGEVDVEPGICVFVGPEHLPDTHSVRNIGTGPVTFLRVDLLGGDHSPGTARISDQDG